MADSIEDLPNITLPSSTVHHSKPPSSISITGYMLDEFHAMVVQKKLFALEKEMRLQADQLQATRLKLGDDLDRRIDETNQNLKRLCQDEVSAQWRQFLGPNISAGQPLSSTNFPVAKPVGSGEAGWTERQEAGWRERSLARQAEGQHQAAYRRSGASRGLGARGSSFQAWKNSQKEKQQTAEYERYLRNQVLKQPQPGGGTGAGSDPPSASASAPPSVPAVGSGGSPSFAPGRIESNTSVTTDHEHVRAFRASQNSIPEQQGAASSSAVPPLEARGIRFTPNSSVQSFAPTSSDPRSTRGSQSAPPPQSETIPPGVPPAGAAAKAAPEQEAAAPAEAGPTNVERHGVHGADEKGAHLKDVMVSRLVEGGGPGPKLATKNDGSETVSRDGIPSGDESHNAHTPRMDVSLKMAHNVLGGAVDTHKNLNNGGGDP